MTDPHTLSLADLAAAVVRLGAHRVNLHVYGAGNPDPIARVYDHPAIITLLTAANRLPAVVARAAELESQLAALCRRCAARCNCSDRKDPDDE